MEPGEIFVKKKDFCVNYDFFEIIPNLFCLEVFLLVSLKNVKMQLKKTPPK